jgi:nicotinamide-nucleotide amidase
MGEARVAGHSCYQLAEQVGQALLQVGATLVTAESCTGGWVACEATAIPGSSQWFERGFVTYTNIAKQEMLGVSAVTLAHYGAVSEQTIREMALGALAHSHAQVAVAISGIAGPTGGSAEKPVGTVWLAWASKDPISENNTSTYYTGEEKVRVRHCLFEGDREQVRQQAVEVAFQGIIDTLKPATDG